MYNFSFLYCLCFWAMSYSELIGQISFLGMPKSLSMHKIRTKLVDLGLVCFAGGAVSL